MTTTQRGRPPVNDKKFQGTVQEFKDARGRI
jgi:hypothetical protein